MRLVSELLAGCAALGQSDWSTVREHWSPPWPPRMELAACRLLILMFGPFRFADDVSTTPKLIELRTHAERGTRLYNSCDDGSKDNGSRPVARCINSWSDDRSQGRRAGEVSLVESRSPAGRRKCPAGLHPHNVVGLQKAVYRSAIRKSCTQSRRSASGHRHLAGSFRLLDRVQRRSTASHRPSPSFLSSRSRTTSVLHASHAPVQTICTSCSIYALRPTPP